MQKKSGRQLSGNDVVRAVVRARVVAGGGLVGGHVEIGAKIEKISHVRLAIFYPSCVTVKFLEKIFESIFYFCFGLV